MTEPTFFDTLRGFGANIGTQLLGAASDAVAAGRNQLGNVLDLPEAGPFFGVAPSGVVTLNRPPQDSSRDPRFSVGPSFTVTRRQAVGGQDRRESPNVALNAGAPGTFSRLVDSPITLAIIAVAVGGVIFALSRK